MHKKMTINLIKWTFVESFKELFQKLAIIAETQTIYRVKVGVWIIDKCNFKTRALLSEINHIR